MTNYYEYRLHQIEILLHALDVDKDRFIDEISKLKEERDSILQGIHAME